MNESLESVRHARSKKDFPFLKLEEEEYVELVITRAKIALVSIWFSASVAFLLLTLLLFNLPSLLADNLLLVGIGDMMGIFTLAFFVLYFLIFAIACICTKVHFGNKLFVTNKRAIQKTVTGLFSDSINVVELSRIEDVSFKQSNILQKLFNYGTIRMSTVGDETTYTFPFVATPTDEIQTISHLVHVIREKRNKEN